uniref:Uncharacterized protein n=1 Tax=Arundo donax TaxID=35708 RepID=A0A0A9EGI2_ARUDO
MQLEEYVSKLLSSNKQIWEEKKQRYAGIHHNLKEEYSHLIMYA